MLIASRNQGEICRLKAQLSKEFEMKDLGEAKKILGMEIARDRQRCDAPKPGGPLTTRQPAEYKWRSGYPTPL